MRLILALRLNSCTPIDKLGRESSPMFSNCGGAGKSVLLGRGALWNG